MQVDQIRETEIFTVLVFVFQSFGMSSQHIGQLVILNTICHTSTNSLKLNVEVLCLIETTKYRPLIPMKNVTK